MAVVTHSLTENQYNKLLFCLFVLSLRLKCKMFLKIKYMQFIPTKVVYYICSHIRMGIFYSGTAACLSQIY